MDALKLLIDLHKPNKRQGPGGDDQTLEAFRLTGLDPKAKLKIADVGCGTGAQTMVLAKLCENAKITAIDLFPQFTDALHERAKSQGLNQRIRTLNRSMDDLPFQENELDLFWAEGSAYIMGFQKALNYWKKFLKPGASLALTEISWLSEERPREIEAHWKGEYPEIDTTEAKIAIAEKCGYRKKGSFTLPQSCWTENYYKPLEDRFENFLKENDASEEAQRIVEAERKEIALYRKYKAYYGYVFFVLESP